MNHRVLTCFRLALLCSVVLALLSCASKSSSPLIQTELDSQPLKMLSAFFGLDNELPLRAAWIWTSAPGKDGMPVIFSHRVEEPIDPAAFTVVTRSGARLQPLHATTRPAHETDERHTVLLIGDFGNEPDDPPVKVEVTGHLSLVGGADANGLSVEVTPLADGPSLKLAYAARPGDLASNCPPESKKIVVVVWAGGVRRVPGVDAEAHRLGYSVATMDGDVFPIAIGNLGDGDNYEHLCLDASSKLLRVSMKEGLLMDPRDDPNPSTSVEVAGAILH